MSTQRVLRNCLALLAACLFVAATASPVQAQQGLGERIGQQLDRGVDRLSEEFREGWQSLRKSVDQLGVRGRVYSRLRWDKQLTDSEIDIDVEEEGVVALRGQVTSAEAKKKATQLATDTVGVHRVVNELTIEATDESPPEDSENDLF